MHRHQNARDSATPIITSEDVDFFIISMILVVMLAVFQVRFDVTGMFAINPTEPLPSNTTGYNFTINMNITDAPSLSEVIFNWNGTNYTLYNSSLTLMANLDNISDIGDNETNAIDISIYGNNLTVVSNASWISSGRYGGGIFFPGSSGYLIKNCISNCTGSPVNANCSQFTSPEDCNLYSNHNSQCTWNPCSGTPYNPDCSQFSSAETCEADNNHYGECTSSYLCTGTPSTWCFSYTDQTNCEANNNHGGCTWNPTQCPGGCTCSGSDSATCLASCELGCGWTDASCSGGCTCSGEDSTTCLASCSNCVWTDIQCPGGCTCSGEDNTTCLSSCPSGCSWTPPDDCSCAGSYESECLASCPSGCVWDAEVGCSGGCSQCQGNGSCSGGCTETPASCSGSCSCSGGDSDDCYASCPSGCVWTDASCSGGCSEIPSSCSGTATCQQNQAYCQAEAGCSWVWQGCTGTLTCGAQQSATSCSSLLGCSGYNCLGTMTCEAQTSEDLACTSIGCSLDVGFQVGQSNTWALFAWVNSSSTGTRKDIFDAGPLGSSLALYINAQNKLQVSLGASQGPSSVTTITDGTWHYVGVVYDGTNISVYVDGNKENSSSSTPNIGCSYFVVGANINENNYYFNGTIDEIRVWNSSLSEDEVREQYYSNLNKHNAENWTLTVNQIVSSAGNYTYQAFIKDLSNNMNQSNLSSVFIDIPPAVNLTSPQNGTLTNNQIVNFNCSATDNSLKNITLYHNISGLWSANNTVNISGEQNSTNWTFFDVADGDYVWNCLVYDTAGQSNWSASNSTIRIDTTLPEVVINLPTNTTYTIFNITFNFTLNEPGNCEYSLDSGATNHTMTSNTTNMIFISAQNLSDSSFTVNAYCNDTAGNVNNTVNVSFTVLAPPIIVLSGPENDTTVQGEQTFTCNISDNNQISNLTLYIWNSTGNMIYSNTTNLTGTSNSTNWTYNISTEGTFQWNCLGYDILNLSAWGNYNYTIYFDTTPPSVLLIKPLNGTITGTGTTSFGCNISDNTRIKNVTLYVWGCPRTTTAIFYWKFNEGNGTKAVDSSINNKNGTLYGPTWDVGIIGSGLRFDGVDDVVKLDSPLSNSTVNNFTMSMWVKPEATRTATTETTAGISSCSGQRYAIHPTHGDDLWGSGHAGAGISVGTNGVSVFEHAAYYAPSLLVWNENITNWTLVTVVYQNKQPKLYINGNLVKTGLTSTKTYVHPGAQGSNSGVGDGLVCNQHNAFKGLIDEVQIYNRSLNASEVADLYANYTLSMADSCNSIIYTKTKNVSGVSGYGNFSYPLPYSGSFRWNCLGNDFANHSSWGENNYSIYADTTLPGISLNIPQDNSRYAAGLNGTDIEFICVATDDVGLSNVTLYHNINGSFTAINTSNTSGVKSYAKNMTVENVMFGTYNWNCQAYDVTNRSAFSASNNTFHVLYMDGLTCNSSSVCYGGYCVHNICWSLPTYCGDGFCDSGETCSSCAADCGSCSGISSEAGRTAATKNESQNISVSAEPEKTTIKIESIEAGKTASIDISSSGTAFYRMEITAKSVIENATINITPASETVNETLQFAIKIGEVVYDIIDVRYAGFSKEALDKVVFKFAINKPWIDSNIIRLDTATLYHLKNGDLEPLNTTLIGENETSYFFKAISPSLSVFAVTAVSSPLLCTVCTSGEWSSCINGQQSRLTNECNENTNYTCKPRYEMRQCETPSTTAPALPTPIEVMIVPAIAMSLAVFLLLRSRQYYGRRYQA